jgi:hypothetical protein
MRFFDPSSGEYFDFPLSRASAIDAGFSRFIDLDGCADCRARGPYGGGAKARYVDGEVCYACFQIALDALLDSWARGAPGKPSPFPLSARDAATLGTEYFYSIGAPRGCPGGPHVARVDVATGHCLECAAVAERVQKHDIGIPITDGRRTPDSILVEECPDLIISPEAARAAGSLVYRTGEPCHAGHRSYRYLKTGGCWECRRSRGNR